MNIKRAYIYCLKEGARIVELDTIELEWLKLKGKATNDMVS